MRRRGASRVAHPVENAGNESDWRGVCEALAVTIAVRRRAGIPPAKPAHATTSLARRGPAPRRGNATRAPARLKQSEHRPEPNMRAQRACRRSRHKRNKEQRDWRGVCEALAVTIAVRRREGIPPAKPDLATSSLARRGSNPMRGNATRAPPRLKRPEHRPKPNMRARARVATESPQPRNSTSRFDRFLDLLRGLSPQPGPESDRTATCR